MASVGWAGPRRGQPVIIGHFEEGNWPTNERPPTASLQFTQLKSPMSLMMHVLSHANNNMVNSKLDLKATTTAQNVSLLFSTLTKISS